MPGMAIGRAGCESVYFRNTCAQLAASNGVAIPVDAVLKRDYPIEEFLDDIASARDLGYVVKLLAVQANGDLVTIPGHQAASLSRVVVNSIFLS